MGERSGIEWTDATWNPWQGCHKVSSGCKNCYMFQDKERFGQEPDIVVRSSPRTFNLPLRLKEPARIFTCSWSDFFIEEADPWRDEAWDIIRRTPHLTYQIVTKRIERAVGRLPWGSGEPWPNVWLIVSAEDQRTLDERVPRLLATSAAVRGVSAEPLLGAMSLARWFPIWFDAIEKRWTKAYAGSGVEHRRGIDWVIVGGESGRDARSMDLEWLREIARQCRAAEVACFVKQFGSFPVFYREVGSGKGGSYVPMMKLRHPKGGDPTEWPEDLRMREYPR